jgi:hypothetical protein
MPNLDAKTYEEYLFEYVSGFPLYYADGKLSKEPFEGAKLVRPISEDRWNKIQNA